MKRGVRVVHLKAHGLNMRAQFVSLELATEEATILVDYIKEGCRQFHAVTSLDLEAIRVALARINHCTPQMIELVDSHRRRVPFGSEGDYRQWEIVGSAELRGMGVRR